LGGWRWFKKKVFAQSINDYENNIKSYLVRKFYDSSALYCSVVLVLMESGTIAYIADSGIVPFLVLYTVRMNDRDIAEFGTDFPSAISRWIRAKRTF